MSDKQLTPAQESKITEIKKQWIGEAEPYLNAPKQNGAVLDGPISTALAQIQLKYKQKVKRIMEGLE